MVAYNKTELPNDAPTGRCSARWMHSLVYAIINAKMDMNERFEVQNSKLVKKYYHSETESLNHIIMRHAESSILRRVRLPT